jgi:hypothetical protein
MTKKSDSVFISYRRKTSKYQALLVYTKLTERGYDVFIDYESIDSGKFAPQILNQIESRRHFVVILSPGSLDRTANPGDWLRKEIEYAMETERNIVPLMFDGFKFEDAEKHLKGKLSSFKEYNGLQVPDGYFDDAMRKLINRFLKRPVKGVLRPAPKSDKSFVQKAIQEAENAMEQKDVTAAFRRYLEAPITPGKSTSSRRASEIDAFHLPATKKNLLGRDPINGEFIKLSENARVTDLNRFSIIKDLPVHEGKIIITNQRLIIINFEATSSVEITREKLSDAKITYKKGFFLDTQLKIQLYDKEEYVCEIASKVKKKVEKLIGGDTIFL